MTANSYRFFNNNECEYFPCHKTAKPERFNCLFCFCPLYFFEDCGGNFRILESGIKDCTKCLLPHGPKGYDHVVGKIKARLDEVRADAAQDES